MSDDKIVLITDLDNTLYDFAAYFSPCFRAMVHALSKELKIDEDTLVLQFRDVYELHGTLEYTFVVQELAIVRDQPQPEIDRLVHIANVAFGRTRRRRLKLYPHVKEMLTWARANGAHVCAVTNAPAYQAYRRLRDLGIFGNFSAISARDGIHVPAALSESARTHSSAYENMHAKLKYLHTFPYEALKPRIAMLEGVQHYWASNFVGTETRFLSIGDSIQNDLQPSSKLGMTTVWARYGTQIASQDYQTMISVTPRRTLKELSNKENGYVPDFVIDDFRDLRKILPYSYQEELI